MAMRAIRVPRLLVAIFGLMWRYLFVLADEALRLLRARSARSGLIYRSSTQKMTAENAEKDRISSASTAHSAVKAALPGGKVGGTVAWRARVTGGMAGSLFLRSFERSDRIYAAMAARGYDGEVRAFPLPVIAPVSWVVLVGGLSLLGLLTLFGYLFWG
jgi:cobalt/nickel transport system permease protein